MWLGCEFFTCILAFQSFFYIWRFHEYSLHWTVCRLDAGRVCDYCLGVMPDL